MRYILFMVCVGCRLFIQLGGEEGSLLILRMRDEEHGFLGLLGAVIQSCGTAQAEGRNHLATTMCQAKGRLLINQYL